MKRDLESSTMSSYNKHYLQLENETDRQAIKHTSGLTTAIAPSGISFYLFVWLYMTKKKKVSYSFWGGNGKSTT